jgi:hypothetical protein
MGPTKARGILTLCLSDDVPGTRRGKDERRANLRVGIFVSAAGRQLCLIRNLSRGGARVRVYRRFRLGSRATLDLKTGHRIKGTVVWAQQGHVGLEFDAPVDIEQLFSTESLAAKGHRARLPRVECDAAATVRVGTQIIKGRVVDISQGGIKLESDQAIEPGEAVVLLPDLYPLASSVRWTDGRYSGIGFKELVPFRRLLDWTRTWSSAEPEPVSSTRAILPPLEDEAGRAAGSRT